VAIAADERAVHAIAFLATVADLAGPVGRRLGRRPVAIADAPAAARSIVRAAADELDRYAETRDASFGAWRLPVALEGISDWDARILGAVAAIPWGATVAYGGVASAAGAPGAARAAGGAIGRNPLGVMVPCHRVVAADGTIGGYGGTWPADREALIALKRALLAHEGVEIAVNPDRRAGSGRRR
jgi:methylated-DNA-[protein]-cysteine S-methyltransferase